MNLARLFKAEEMSSTVNAVALATAEYRRGSRVANATLDFHPMSPGFKKPG
jgi:hypothetical protein